MTGVLASLLEHDTDQVLFEFIQGVKNYFSMLRWKVRTYVHGALYSLLSHPRIRAVAAEHGMEKG